MFMPHMRAAASSGNRRVNSMIEYCDSDDSARTGRLRSTGAMRRLMHDGLDSQGMTSGVNPAPPRQPRGRRHSGPFVNVRVPG